jgi:hypothetical protein
MNQILGVKKRSRIAGMFANFAQIVLGASFVSHFFKEGPRWMKIIALSLCTIFFVSAIIAEPENGGN